MMNSRLLSWIKIGIEKFGGGSKGRAQPRSGSWHPPKILEAPQCRVRLRSLPGPTHRPIQERAPSSHLVQTSACWPKIRLLGEASDLDRCRILDAEPASGR